MVVLECVSDKLMSFVGVRRPPSAPRTNTRFPTRRSSDLGADQSVSRLTLVQFGSDLLAQRRILEPAKRKQGALDTADVAQCGCQRVLLTERRKLFEDQRRRDDLVEIGRAHV